MKKMKMCLDEFQSSPINLISGELATIAPGRGETRARMLPDLFPSRYYSTFYKLITRYNNGRISFFFITTN